MPVLYLSLFPSLAIDKPLLHNDVVGRGNNVGDCPTALPGEDSRTKVKGPDGRGTWYTELTFLSLRLP